MIAEQLVLKFASLLLSGPLQVKIIITVSLFRSYPTNVMLRTGHEFAICVVKNEDPLVLIASLKSSMVIVDTANAFTSTATTACDNGTRIRAVADYI